MQPSTLAAPHHGPVFGPGRFPIPSPAVAAPGPAEGMDLATSADARHLAAARQGDATAFETLVRRHQGPLLSFCTRFLGQADDAADVVQETFVQLYGHLDRLSEREPLAPWLFRVARNRSIDVIRRRRTVSLTLSDEAAFPDPVDQQPLPDELAERADLQRLLERAIASLPPAYGEVVALRYAADRSFAEIAEILGCDEGSARVRFHRAKAFLRPYLRSFSGHP